MAALSGRVDGARLRRGLGALEAMGFRPVPAANLSARDRTFAGGDDERLEAFHDLLRDESIEAVLFARGGHGVLRVLDRVDWELVGRRPRAFVGYSDLTPFLMGVVDRLGTAAFHGPMVAADLARGLEARESETFLAALAGRLPVELPVRRVRGGGVVRGAVRGGCLSLLAAVAGSRAQTSLDDSLFFWEDIDEPVYRLDRMLVQLRAAGALGTPRAMIVGRTALREGEISERWPEELLDLLPTAELPVAADCPSGHAVPNLALPLGVEAELRLDEGRLLVG